MNVLIACRDPFLRAIVMMWANSRGWAPGAAASGRVALARLLSNTPDLLTFNPHLSVAPGRPLLQCLACDPRLRMVSSVCLQQEEPPEQARRRAPIPLADFWAKAMAAARSSAPHAARPDCS